MKAIILKQVNELELAEIPVPEIKAGEVLVKVKAIDVNPVDNKTLQGKGQYAVIKDNNPVILGWDISGEVTEVGAGVTQFKKGDAVFGMVNFPGHGKAYAAYVAAPAAHLALKPANVSHEEAVATTLSALTAYQAIRTANVQAGERVFIQGVAGGVGFFALQIAKRLGAYVIGTAAAKDAAIVQAAGLDELIDYKTQAFEKATGNIDFVFDTLGGDAAIKAFDILRPGGRLITIPSGKGEDWKTVAAERGINAAHFRVHSSGEDMQVLAGWLQDGSLKPNIARQFRFSELIQVHALMSAGKLNGKLVVSYE